MRGELIYHILNTYQTGVLNITRFRATLYQCPESAAERNEMVESVVNRINDLETVWDSFNC